MTNTDKITASKGCELIADTSAKTNRSFYALIIQEDTVIATLSGVDENYSTVNFLTTIGLASKTLKQGALITVPSGNKITSLTLTSGSLIAYNV